MPTIRIADATYRAILGMAVPPHEPVARRQHDGAWLLEVGNVWLDALRELRLAGETYDDVIIRIIKIRGQPHSQRRQYN